MWLLVSMCESHSGIELREPLRRAHIGPVARIHLAGHLAPVHRRTQQGGQRQCHALGVAGGQAAVGKKGFFVQRNGAEGVRATGAAFGQVEHLARS